MTLVGRLMVISLFSLILIVESIIGVGNRMEGFNPFH